MLSTLAEPVRRRALPAARRGAEDAGGAPDLVTALTAGEKWPVYLSDAIGDARAVLCDVEVPR
jgi:hypothetical protein